MKRREHELVGSVVDWLLSSFSHPVLRRGMVDRPLSGEPVTVQGWRLGPHRPSDVGLYDTVRIDPDGTVTRVRPILELNSAGAKCVVGYEDC